MYWMIRILVVVLMAAPIGFFLKGMIELGDLCLLIGICLILIELADINRKLDKDKST